MRLDTIYIYTCTKPTSTQMQIYRIYIYDDRSHTQHAKATKATQLSERSEAAHPGPRCVQVESGQASDWLAFDQEPPFRPQSPEQKSASQGPKPRTRVDCPIPQKQHRPLRAFPLASRTAPGPARLNAKEAHEEKQCICSMNTGT